MIGFLRRRRRARLRAAPFPPEWIGILRRNVVAYKRLPAARQEELHGHVHVLLSEKHFEGCGGLELTDEMRVTIAGHAALLMLGREPHYYPRLVSILVYPSWYRAPVRETDDDGIVSEDEEERFGESWEDGVVVLAWDAARHGSRDLGDGSNLILHEFAHQLDSEDGSADGRPFLDHAHDPVAWAAVLGAEYERLREQPDDSVLDEYGAEDPAEFFAVATEAFFERPDALRNRHPELYEQLRTYYRIEA